MIRATVARGLRLLASLIDGSDPVADVIRSLARTQADVDALHRETRKTRGVADLARDEAAETRGVAERTRGVVGAMLREGVAGAESGADALVAAGTLTREQVDGWPVRSPTLARSRELLADLADAEDEPPRVAGGDD